MYTVEDHAAAIMADVPYPARSSTPAPTNYAEMLAMAVWGENEAKLTADDTAPTLSTLAVPSAGTTVTGTLSEACTPASGTGGFTLGGTDATVASWAISGTTLTLTLTGTVYDGETVTLSYSRAGTTDDIEDGAGLFLQDFADAPVVNNSQEVQPSGGGTVVLLGAFGFGGGF